MFAFIVPFSKTFDNIGLVYKVPVFLQPKLKLGQIVEIPIKNKLDLGVIYKINEDFRENYDISKIKDILNIKNENVFLSSYRLELLPFIAEYYFCPIHNSLSLFLPKNLIEKIGKGKLDFEERKYSEIMSFGHVKRVQCKLQSESIKIGKHLNSTAKLAVSPFPLPRGKGLGDGSVYSYTFNFSNTLTQNQEKVYNDIKSSKNNKILLFGVTGSGKTEIYIKLIKDTLEAGKQSLFLIPEIILGNQILDKIKEVFGKDVIIINSTITEAQKTKYFLDILHNQAKIILGTRSALFYPYDNNLGLIIIDEEHDNSYISEKAPRYNAVEVAEKIAEISGKLKAESGKEIKLLLASGTPSINSMYNGVKGKYELINLLEKYR